MEPLVDGIDEIGIAEHGGCKLAGERIPDDDLLAMPFRPFDDERKAGGGPRWGEMQEDVT